MVELALTPKKPLQLEVFSYIVKCISRYIPKKLSGCLLSLAGLKEMLNAIEVFMIIEHEEILILFALRQILQLLHRV